MTIAGKMSKDCRSALKGILALSRTYETLQNVFDGMGVYKTYIDEHLLVKGGEEILDVGCGTSSILALLPTNIHYTGIDISQTYLDKASHTYRNRGEWVQGCTSDLHKLVGFEEKFDVIMANGVLHHLDDSEMQALSSSIHKLLKDGGRFVTIDCCYTQKQGAISRLLTSLDRGKHVRRPEHYKRLIDGNLWEIKQSVRSDMSKTPYIYTVHECAKR